MISPGLVQMIVRIVVVLLICYFVLMRQQIVVKVQNVENDHVHFKRSLDLPDGLQIPYNEIQKSLRWLFQGLNVEISVSQSIYNEHLNLNK